MAPQLSNPKKWTAFLTNITGLPSVHARWLNTLSMMEHIGCRKIVKALDSNMLDEALLRHIAEEARHAHFFKKLSLRIAKDACRTYEPDQVFCGDASRHYFQSLDRAVAEYLGGVSAAQGPALVYLCVTTLIEIRATQIYKLYEDVLRERGLSISLRSVITEEGRHLAEMHEAFDRMRFVWSSHAGRLHAIESELFEVWSMTLHATLEACKAEHATPNPDQSLTPLDTM